jgi:hypothetical protein
MFVNQTIQLTLFCLMSLKLPLPSDKHPVNALELGLPLSIQADNADNDDKDSDQEGNGDNDTLNVAIKTSFEADKSTTKPVEEALLAKPRFMDVLHVITQDVYTTIFFITIVLSGMGAGVIENFLFIFIEELGGDKTIQGLARFVMCAAEVSCHQRSYAAGDNACML